LAAHNRRSQAVFGPVTPREAPAA